MSPTQLHVWGKVVPLVGIALALGWMLPALWVPETIAVRPEIVLPCYENVVRPEPLEQLRYLIAIIVAPLVLWSGAWSPQRKQGKPLRIPCLRCRLRAVWPKAMQFAVAAIGLAAVFYQEHHSELFGQKRLLLALAIALVVSGGIVLRVKGEPLAAQASVIGIAFAFWVGQRWALRHDGMVVLLPAAALILAACIFRPRVRQTTPDLSIQNSSPPRGWWELAAFLFAVTMTIVELLPCIYSETSARVFDHFEFHVPVQMGEFAAVLGGRTPHVDFYPQYQTCLSYLLQPVFEVVGLSVATFTVSMAGLSLIGLLVIFACFRQVTGSSWTACLLYVPFLGLCFTPQHPAHPEAIEKLTAFTYFAVAPLRYFGPWMTFGALTLYLRQPSRWRMRLVFGIGALAALNNLDFGLPALAGAFVAVLFSTPDGPRPARRFWAETGSNLAAMVGLSIVGYALIAWLRSGQFPRLEAMLFFPRAFAGTGFMMLPMPVFGLHVAIFLTFMAAIGRGLYGDPNDRLRNGLLLFAGISGAGSFAYYVGRSHPAVLVCTFPAWALALMLLTEAAIHAIAQRPRASILSASLICLLFGCSVGVLQLRHFPRPLDQCARIADCHAPSWAQPQTPEIIARYSKPREPVAVIYPFGHLNAIRANVKNVYPFADDKSLILCEQIRLTGACLDRRGVRHVFGYIGPDLAEELERRGFRQIVVDRHVEVWERNAESFSGEPPASH